VRKLTLSVKKNHATAKVSSAKWQATIALRPGNNTLAALVTDVLGNTAQTVRRIRVF
jgi:hypothetical protein